MFGGETESEMAGEFFEELPSPAGYAKFFLDRTKNFVHSLTRKGFLYPRPL